ncbi:hypothetical protein BRARA_E01584 [Brassica rapa]|uniref:Uncharacterized protein n=1 Tax=Brassica campestris TaxID=3711 RepID=A0A397ZHG5_BRACM|nr:hypothetical protein BRARA_E01584 [Brassica rapa]
MRIRVEIAREKRERATEIAREKRGVAGYRKGEKTEEILTEFRCQRLVCRNFLGIFKIPQRLSNGSLTAIIFPRNSSVFSEEYSFSRYSIRIFRLNDIFSEFRRYIPRKLNFVFPRNILGNSSGYSEDFIFRRNVCQNTAIFL